MMLPTTMRTSASLPFASLFLQLIFSYTPYIVAITLVNHPTSLKLNSEPHLVSMRLIARGDYRGKNTTRATRHNRHNRATTFPLVPLLQAPAVIAKFRLHAGS